MTEYQLIALTALKKNATELLEQQEEFGKDSFYTCLKLNKSGTTFSLTLLEKLSHEFNLILANELDMYYPYSTAFLHSYLTMAFPDEDDISNKLKELRIRWLNFIIDYPES